MKAKLMIILAMLGLMLTMVSCESEPIEDGEPKQPFVDETVAVLIKNDWGCKLVTGSGATEKTTEMKLHFTEPDVTLFSKTTQQGSIKNLTYTTSYTISTNGKTINMSILAKPYTLDFSTEKLSGLWDNVQVEFLPIK